MRTKRPCTYLSIVDACVTALLIAALSGCATRASIPSNYRDRTGDFVQNIASTNAVPGFTSQSAINLPRA